MAPAASATSALLLVLLLAAARGAPRVAIIGAGVGGAFAADKLRSFVPDAEIHV